MGMNTETPGKRVEEICEADTKTSDQLKSNKKCSTFYIIWNEWGIIGKNKLLSQLVFLIVSKVFFWYY